MKRRFLLAALAALLFSSPAEAFSWPILRQSMRGCIGAILSCCTKRKLAVVAAVAVVALCFYRRYKRNGRPSAHSAGLSRGSSAGRRDPGIEAFVAEATRPAGEHPAYAWIGGKRPSQPVSGINAFFGVTPTADMPPRKADR